MESTSKDNQECKPTEFPVSGVERYAKNLCNRIEKYGQEQTHLLLYKPAVLDKYSKPKIETVSFKESFMLEFKHENKLKVQILSLINRFYTLFKFICTF